MLDVPFASLEGRLRSTRPAGRSLSRVRERVAFRTAEGRVRVRMPQDVAILTDVSSAALAGALDANVIELWRLICAALPDAEFHQDAEATWFITGSTIAPWLNQVLRAGFVPGDLDRGIERLLAKFAETPMLWSVLRSTSPADLGALLEARGLVHSNSMPGMALDLETLPNDAPVPQALSIQHVRDADALELWAQAYIAGFEMEERAGRILHEAYSRAGFADDAPLRHYAGLIEGQPVASATFFLGAGVAGVWHISTLRAERRQGIGAAMTLAGLRDARALGYRVATLYASEPGLGVYQRLGFRPCNEMVQYTTGRIRDYVATP